MKKKIFLFKLFSVFLGITFSCLALPWDSEPVNTYLRSTCTGKEDGHFCSYTPSLNFNSGEGFTPEGIEVLKQWRLPFLKKSVSSTVS